jgi:4-hydroxybenzoate polyprenyltransferase
VICGGTAASLAAGERFGVTWTTVVAAFAVACAFLQLRILDEIRDEDADRAGRPDRPLPSGLVTVPELRAFALVLALFGVVLAASLGAAASACYALALLTIWLLGSDLPGRLPIRHGVLGYALMHSIIVPEILLFVWATVGGPSGGGALAASVLLVWGAGLAMEIGRKTLMPSEERPGVETYSGELGRPRAVALAALAVSVACVGAGALAVEVGAASTTAIVPFVAAGTIPLLARSLGDRIGTSAIRSASGILVLSVLLWPLVVALGIP